MSSLTFCTRGKNSKSGACVYNHERHALDELEKLRQTGSVVEYKASHDVLAAHTILPVHLRISWWERGLKDDIRAMCSVDPLTHKQYTNIAKAQSAACACDAHLKSSAAAAAVTRKRPSTAAARVNQRPHQRSRVTDSAGNIAKVVKWQGDDSSVAEPLPSFFKDWIAGCPTSESGTYAGSTGQVDGQHVMHAFLQVELHMLEYADLHASC